MENYRSEEKNCGAPEYCGGGRSIVDEDSAMGVLVLKGVAGGGELGHGDNIR